MVGAGPAGLMAAEAAAEAGGEVFVADAMPSFGRKFLMAGKSGLNLTKAEAQADFLAAFHPLPPPLRAALEAFGPNEVQEWARGLGQEVFTGSSGRVFPVAMKASPLLRAWLARLDGAGVRFARRWRWTGWTVAGGLRFTTPEGAREVEPAAAVFGLGGASWPRLGSDGGWAGLFAARGVALAPFRPSNMGFAVNWSAHMAPFFGRAVKAAALRAGDLASRGEFVISARGVEGGAVYAVSRAVRDGAPLVADLLPDLDAGTIAARLAGRRKGETLARRLRAGLRLDDARRALLMEFGRPLPDDFAALAALLKALPVAHAGPRPIAEAISTAGGVAWEACDERLMLHAMPGTFCAGEMLDWEAPTGGYLLTACLATGRAAGAAAALRARGG